MNSLLGKAGAIDNPKDRGTRSVPDRYASISPLLSIDGRTSSRTLANTTSSDHRD
jgi:hypothetical protein